MTSTPLTFNLLGQVNNTNSGTTNTINWSGYDSFMGETFYDGYFLSIYKNDNPIVMNGLGQNGNFSVSEGDVISINVHTAGFPATSPPGAKITVTGSGGSSHISYDVGYLKTLNYSFTWTSSYSNMVIFGEIILY